VIKLNLKNVSDYFLDVLRYSLVLESSKKVGIVKLDKLLDKVNMSRRTAIVDVLINFCDGL
jgi:hypothetical protein